MFRSFIFVLLLTAVSAGAQTNRLLITTLNDPFELLSPQKIRTHTNGKAYDRILFSNAMTDGVNGLTFEIISVREHPFGKGTNRYWFTDHFPVTAVFAATPKAK